MQRDISRQSANGDFLGHAQSGPALVMVPPAGSKPSTCELLRDIEVVNQNRWVRQGNTAYIKSSHEGTVIPLCAEGCSKIPLSTYGQHLFKLFLRVFAHNGCTASHISISPLDYLQYLIQGGICVNSFITLSRGSYQEGKYDCVQNNYNLGRIFPSCTGCFPTYKPMEGWNSLCLQRCSQTFS